MNSKLFSGTEELLGGLSNEEELVGLCPEEFKKRDNPWTRLASNLFHDGGNISHWKWKRDKEKDNELSCLRGILGSFGVSHKDKEAIAGWMLSEMLIELPEYKPLKSDG